jgi:hypothetical protein
VDISNEFQDFSNMTRQLQTNRYRRPVQFYAMGDAPYGKVERHLLRLQMKKLDHKVNDYKVDFMAHVGGKFIGLYQLLHTLLFSIMTYIQQQHASTRTDVMC